MPNDFHSSFNESLGGEGPSKLWKAYVAETPSGHAAIVLTGPPVGPLAERSSLALVDRTVTERLGRLCYTIAPLMPWGAPPPPDGDRDHNERWHTFCALLERDGKPVMLDAGDWQLIRTTIEAVLRGIPAIGEANRERLERLVGLTDRTPDQG